MDALALGTARVDELVPMHVFEIHKAQTFRQGTFLFGSRRLKSPSHCFAVISQSDPLLAKRGRSILDMKHIFSVMAIATLAVSWCACGSNSSGSLSSDGGKSPSLFSSSACKKEKSAATRLAHLRTLKVIDNESGLQGLRCVAWQRVGVTELKVDLFNFDAACGASWTGDAAVAADGMLNLHVDNPSCTIALCGKCLYDWSFDVNAPLAAGEAVPVAIAVDSCAASQSATTWSASIGSEDKGIHCTLADYGAMTWQASATSTCGEAGMPCVGSLLCGTGQFTSTGTCTTGLVCDSSAAANQPVCLVPCTTNAECPRADVWSCQAGLCRPIA